LSSKKTTRYFHQSPEKKGDRRGRVKIRSKEVAREKGNESPTTTLTKRKGNRGRGISREIQVYIL